MLDQVRAAFPELEVQALWVAKPANIRYLTGFTSPEDGKLLVLEDAAVLYTDSRYTVQAQEESRVPVHIARWEEVFTHAKPLVAGKSVGFEADAVVYSSFKEMLEGLGTTLKPVKNVVEPLRGVKNAAELEVMRRAAKIADDALEATLPMLKPGVAERDVALELEMQMRKRGAEAAAFDITVASGERGAMPHGGASSRVIRDGELVTIDWGARVDGYHSDCTRTYAVGEVPGDLKKMYNTVLDAQLAALEVIKAGAKCFDMDKVARDHITAAGYGEYFGHSLGHSVGLAVHETPSLSFRAKDELLEVGNVVTVEPGIYVPGVGGVRIEDTVLVTADGVEFLTHLPKIRL
jgi:Xaa-Pro aminopeptidase